MSEGGQFRPQPGVVADLAEDHRQDRSPAARQTTETRGTRRAGFAGIAGGWMACDDFR